MKQFLILFTILFTIIGNPQKDKIYRIEGENKDAVGYSYFVNVLKLKDDKHYTLIEQEYVSKKFARKNIPSRFIQTYGVWGIENDTLKLIDDSSKETILFVVVDNNNLDRLFNDEVQSNYYWKRVKD